MMQTELWLTPLILLPGVALLIMSTSARFQLAHDEFHHLLDHPGNHVKIMARQLYRRAAWLRDALLCLYVSVAVFSLGSFLGGLINFLMPKLLWFVGLLTLCGIVCLVLASVFLVRESFLCLQIIGEHHTILEELPAEE